jgi:ferredoxin-type protein NapH
MKNRSIGIWLNRLRWTSLTLVFFLLVLLPYITLYQSYEASHAYDFLAPSEQKISDAMEALTSPFVSDPIRDLNTLKGSTWSGVLFGIKLSDPLAWVSQLAASGVFYWAFFITAVFPILVTMLFGRVFCGWICPANFIYELNDHLAGWLKKVGFPIGEKRFDLRLKYLVLIIGLLLSAVTGVALLSVVYPPAILGREFYYIIALNGMGVGIVFFLVTLGLDLLLSRRFFCRYLCPGGALYSLLGRYRLVRIQRQVEVCNDCTLCNQVCQFGLDPMNDGLGQECNNCSACMAVCPTDALGVSLEFQDNLPQGAGHLGKVYQSQQNNSDGK